jgi:hypothetical protein
MNTHRSTRSKTPKNQPLDNFNPADALESLHTEVVQLETFAHLAAENYHAAADAVEPRATPRPPAALCLGHQGG